MSLEEDELSVGGRSDDNEDDREDEREDESEGDNEDDKELLGFRFEPLPKCARLFV